MNEDLHKTDVIIIGGGSAGSAAALQLGRIGRSVIVADTGEPRNAPAAHMHGFPGFDGVSPAEFVRRAHADLGPYDVQILDEFVTGITHDESTPGRLRFDVEFESGRHVSARRVLLATGLTDLLPPLPGIAAEWGGRVIHCPWCHGWEWRGRRITVIDTDGAGPHQAGLFAQLSGQVTLISTHPDSTDPDERDRLSTLGVTIDHRSAIGVGDSTGTFAVDLSDGTALETDVVVIGPRFAANASALGNLVTVDDHVSGMGTVVPTDEMGRTPRPGIYAAGNVTDPMLQVLHAAAHGSRVGVAINIDLAEEDLERRRTSVASAARWDRRYADHGEQMWSGRPNGSLEVELADQPPATVLDVGCGEGADALWLASRGWRVTAVDISTVAIERAGRAADEAGREVDFAAVDLVTEPPLPASHDLVVISYPALELPDGRTAMQSIADSVIVGGELLVIGHAITDPEAVKAAGFDIDKFLSIDAIVELIDSTFTVLVDEIRDRPNAPEGTMHHHDRVLRARRVA